MRVRPLAIWLAAIILVLAFWPAIVAIAQRLALPLPVVRSSVTWIDIMVFIALALLAIRVFDLKRTAIHPRKE